MDSKIKKSTFFGLDENIAAALAAGLPLVLTFVPYVSYFAWAVPMIVVIFEHKSDLVRLCAGQSLVVEVLMFAAAAAFEFINAIAGDGTNVPFPVALCGMIISIIRVVCAAVMLMTAYNGYLCKEFNIPIVTRLIKNITKYNDM